MTPRDLDTPIVLPCDDGFPDASEPTQYRPMRRRAAEVLPTECTISGCCEPVHPPRKLGLCRKHLARSKTGRMLPSGDLVPATGTRVCASCGATISLTGRSLGRTKYCESCKYDERKKVARENSRGTFRTGDPLKIAKFEASAAAAEQRRADKLAAKAKKAVDKLAARVANMQRNKLRHAEKYAPLILMRRSGATLKVVGAAFNLSGERVRQIVEKYSELIPSHTQEFRTETKPKNPEAQ